MRTALAILLLLAAHTAFAGECSVENMTSMVEARAKKAAPPAAESDFHLCLWWDMPTLASEQPKLAKRLRAACETILTKRVDDELCTNIAALLHEARLGKTDRERRAFDSAASRSRAVDHGASVAVIADVLRTVFAISILVAGCVMPQHRGVATFCNGWMFGGGLGIAAMASSSESNPNSWRDLDHAASDFAAAVILLAATGEVLTVILHHDDPADAPPVQ